jgi:hypothetical protein
MPTLSMLSKSLAIKAAGTALAVIFSAGAVAGVLPGTGAAAFACGSHRTHLVHASVVAPVVTPVVVST